MGEHLHDCLKREASMLSLNSHSLPSAAFDNSPHIYPFSFHGVKLGAIISPSVLECACVFVWEALPNNKLEDIRCILTTKDEKPAFINLAQQWSRVQLRL